MAAEVTGQLFPLLPESDMRQSPVEFGGFGHDFGTAAVHLNEPHAQLSPFPNRSTGPISRLAGEPAFCAGRHCCHWITDGVACNNHYPSAEDLDRHIARDHAGRDVDGHRNADYRCHWARCAKHESFHSKPKLTRHVHSHTGHKPYPCPYPGCDRGFVTKEQLKNHETTHTRTRGHVCPECGKGFAVKTALTSHMNVHRGAKPHVCDECGKGFADSSNLSKHKAIHRRTSLKHGHSRRHVAMSDTASSASAGTTPTLFSPIPPAAAPLPHPLFTPSFAPPYYAPSIEPAPLPHDLCALPACFDSACSPLDRIPCDGRSASPCKSAPCSNRDCSPATFAPCAGADACRLDACAQDACPGLADCAAPECGADECDLEACHAQFCRLGDYCHTAQDCPLPASPLPAPDQQRVGGCSVRTSPDLAEGGEGEAGDEPRLAAWEGVGDFAFDGFGELSDFALGIQSVPASTEDREG